MICPCRLASSYYNESMSPNTLISVRIEPELLARIDAHCQSISEQHQGVRISRSEAIRALCRHALDGIEQPKRKRR